MSVLITGVQPDSPCGRAGVCPGSRLLSIGRHTVNDVLDYQFYSMESHLKLYLEHPDGKPYMLRIRKGEDEDLGLEFETYLMSKQTGCRNKCIFCFIDQLPKGLRDSLYFKDDDERLSFLFGNYITLTNLDEEHIDRIIKMRISPVNISVHTTDPALRVRMMKNKDAGKVLRYLPKLAEAGIFMNVQLVLCPGWNDGEALERSIRELSALFPQVQSVACVPVGLTKYREGLDPLQPFDRESARSVLETIHRFSDKFLKEYGERMVYPADEFFLMAGVPIPEVSYYGELSQLENGVGMCALLRDEFMSALEEREPDDRSHSVTIATSVAAYGLICDLVDAAVKKWHNLHCEVVPVPNRFFGERITVAGLITGQDFIAALRGRPLGERVLFPANMLRMERDLFLDNTTSAQVSEALGTQAVPVENDGYELLSRLLGE